MSQEIKIIFFGSDDFSSEVLRSVMSKFQISCCIVKNNIDSNFANFARSNEINVVVFKELNKDILKNSDFAIVASFGKIISEDLLNLTEFINVHGSYLPQFRGATPIQTSLLLGYKVGGVTIMKMSKGMDEGDILKQKKIVITKNDNYPVLRDRVAMIGGELLVDVLENINSIIPARQNSMDATYCFTNDFSYENARIDWMDRAEDIKNKVRAFYPAWTMYGGNGVNIYSTEVSDIEADIPGRIFPFSKDLYIGCADFYLKVLKIQRFSKKILSGIDFRNGIQNKDIKFV
jgi:methionyl-tRNA formyltransferase